jgi:hypothetical protein
MDKLHRRKFNNMSNEQITLILNKLAKCILCWSKMNKKIGIFIYPDINIITDKNNPQFYILFATKNRYWHIILYRQTIINKNIISWAVYGKDWQIPLDEPKCVKSCFGAVRELKLIFEKLNILDNIYSEENNFDYLEDYTEF